MIGTLHKMGIKSSLMYTAGFASIGASMASWLVSKNAEAAGIDRADRWGIFIGQWAPTFFALGLALRMEERRDEVDISPEVDDLDTRSAGRGRREHATL
ncbi:hypothetical protein [Nonomuraea endophytica]|uniref:Uncharacterized protein n=1 Tax=Nonomuraea endophytica TaxID=714136 RepID=A0A7W8A8D2_9ACTN|nr:hypothetical protein [Nonomuraea endophytica]MBB5081449.1 hypothetical protein [Nonomuraea endophytica]